jgi:hypothetical protein
MGIRIKFNSCHDEYRNESKGTALMTLQRTINCLNKLVLLLLMDVISGSGDWRVWFKKKDT